MNIFKRLALVFIISLSVLFTMSGCDGDNSDVEEVVIINDGAVNVILPVSTEEVTLNGEIVNIAVTVWDENNIPYETGNVDVILPSPSARDIGTFSSYSLPLDSTGGTVSFAYTAPADLSADTSDIVFEFYHDSDVATSRTFTVTINPDINQTVLASYNLTMLTDDGEVTMNLESSKGVYFDVKDDKGVLVPDADMTSMTITSLNPGVATLADTLGNTGYTLTISGDSSVSINIVSGTVSGIVPIEVETTFTDPNGAVQNLTEVFNIIVLSGPPSAMSLSYASTEQIPTKFIEKWVLTVTDKYTNRVDSNPAVSMGMLSGYVQDSSSTATNPGNYLHFDPETAGSGAISALNDNFTAPSAVFGNVDETNDILVTFGNGYTYNASGKWDINTTGVSSILDLVDDYNSTDTADLGFAVGHNYRQDTCEAGTEWVANVYPEDNNFIIGDDGSLVINVEYDYYLTGKSTMLWVNLVGIQNSTNEIIKIGEARKVNLRGQGLTSEPGTYKFTANSSGTVRFNIMVANTVEWYYNANFGYTVELTGEGSSFSVAGTSMDNGITSCINGGVAYVDVSYTGGTEDGTISLVSLLPADEF